MARSPASHSLFPAAAAQPARGRRSATALLVRSHYEIRERHGSSTAATASRRSTSARILGRCAPPITITCVWRSIPYHAQLRAQQLQNSFLAAPSRLPPRDFSSFAARNGLLLLPVRATRVGQVQGHPRPARRAHSREAEPPARICARTQGRCVQGACSRTAFRSHSCAISSATLWHYHSAV